MPTTYPISLARGSETQVWPLSRTYYPKQFSNLFGGKTLFQLSAGRLTSLEIQGLAPFLIFPHFNFGFIIGRQLHEDGIDPRPILMEPAPKNTAAAILNTAVVSNSTDESTLLIVTSTENVIHKKDQYDVASKVGSPHIPNRGMVNEQDLPIKDERL